MEVRRTLVSKNNEQLFVLWNDEFAASTLTRARKGQAYSSFFGSNLRLAELMQ